MSKPYHRIGVGCGGVFRFPLSTDANEPIYAIGTTGCKYCVGIYVPLTDTKCFAAHIFACCDDPDDHNIQTAKHGYWVPTGTEGTELITKVGELLDEYLDECYLSPEELTALARRAIVVCPNLRRKVDDIEQEMDASGKYIIEALNMYFHTTFTAENAHGFAVNHNTGEYNLFKFEAKGPESGSEPPFEPDSEDELEMVADERHGWSIGNRAGERDGTKNTFRLRVRQEGWEVDYDDSPDQEGLSNLSQREQRLSRR